MPKFKVDHDLLLPYHSQGMTTTEIARRLGVKKQAIQYHIKQHGLTPNLKSRAVDKWRDVIEREGKTLRQRELTDAEILAYEVGLRAGQTVEELAEEHIRDVDFVRDALGVRV